MHKSNIFIPTDYSDGFIMMKTFERILSNFSDEKNPHVSAVTIFVIHTIFLMFYFAINNFSAGMDYLDYHQNQFIVMMITGFIAGGSAYRTKRLFFRLIFSKETPVLNLSIIFMFNGLDIFYRKSIFLNSGRYTGKVAQFFGGIEILLAVFIVYIFVCEAGSKIKKQ
jgi:predicted membrane protein